MAIERPKSCTSCKYYRFDINDRQYRCILGDANCAVTHKNYNERLVLEQRAQFNEKEKQPKSQNPPKKPKRMIQI